MNILVINGSPNGAKSATMMLTRAFLEGMGEQAEIVNVSDINVKPCKACYACWFKTNGQCVQKDDAIEVLEKIKQADLVIWSVPVYCYSVPSQCKALMDRTLCFNSPFMCIGEDDRAHHLGLEDGSKKTVLISSAGLPDVKGNFDGVIFQIRHMYGLNTQVITCSEASLFMQKETRPLTESYLANVRKAGAEYKSNGAISEATQNVLDTPMVPREMYIENTNAVFKQFVK